ncbi:MAG: hypothetical protein OEM96_07695 [Gemmatimonadota bacterium]|nr:hypothetical protein [Gemmatimonadota bacterium]
MSKPDDPVSIRTAEALAAAGLADFRPTYRAVLVRLRKRDAEGFAEATSRYDQVVTAAIESGADPVAAWVGYGAWIARRLTKGRLVQLDETGLATDVTVEPAAAGGVVLLYLPESASEPAIPIAIPAEPSPAQRSALQLLVR